MRLDHVTYQGPAIDDPELLALLPAALADLLRQTNGFILHGGALHVRGACRQPSWHSLRDAWLGADAFHRLYAEVKPEDVPFGQNCLGDQLLLRGDEVLFLPGETGEVEPFDMTFEELIRGSVDNPGETVGLGPLEQFREESGNALQPGQLLATYPPLCTKEAEAGVRLAAVAAEDRRAFLAKFAAFIRDLPEGGRFRIEATE
jgi:hypothetical protein